jgi:hypothetical protein
MLGGFDPDLTVTTIWLKTRNKWLLMSSTAPVTPTVKRPEVRYGTRVRIVRCGDTDGMAVAVGRIS